MVVNENITSEQISTGVPIKGTLLNALLHKLAE